MRKQTCPVEHRREIFRWIHQTRVLPQAALAPPMKRWIVTGNGLPEYRAVIGPFWAAGCAWNSARLTALIRMSPKNGLTLAFREAYRRLTPSTGVRTQRTRMPS